MQVSSADKYQETVKRDKHYIHPFVKKETEIKRINAMLKSE